MEAAWKQTGSGLEADWKQTGSRLEADWKQSGFELEGNCDFRVERIELVIYRRCLFKKICISYKILHFEWFHVVK